MHAVGDGVDGELREHLPRNLAVLQRHAVGIARKPQRQQGHVQQAFVEDFQLLQPRRPLSAQDANGLLGREAVVPGRNRRMRGKHALAAHRRKVGIRGAVQRPAAKLALQQRQRQQRRVPLIHVIHVYMQPQRFGHAHAAHAQHNLLLQPVVGVAAVKVVGQPAVPARVSF